MNCPLTYTPATSGSVWQFPRNTPNGRTGDHRIRGVDVLGEDDVGRYRRQLLALAEKHDCERIAFDLTGVKVITSSVFGLFVTLRKEGVEIELRNASDHVRSTLAVTGLDRLFTIGENCQSGHQ